MNSLEFIDKEIKRHKTIIIGVKTTLKKSRNEDVIKYLKNDLKEYEEKVLHLQQIKTELEAWYVMNEEFIIKPYYQQGKYPAIMVRHPIEDDEVVRRGVKQEKYDKVLKALEVKEKVD